MSVALAIVLATGGLVVYGLLLYPAALRIVGRDRFHDGIPGAAPIEETPGGVSARPHVTACVVAHNEEPLIRECVLAILANDYPRDLLDVVVVSDASDDGTDDVVLAIGDPRVTLVRMPVRGGKTRAENTVAGELRGDIIVNTDASVRLHPGAVSALVSAFADPKVGAASGIDLRDGPAEDDEIRYVGFEMWLRRLESAAGGIVGNSGSIYAIRKSLHEITVPDHLSRDFASALVSHQAGYRSVLVPDAKCWLPASRCLRAEYRRKLRTAMRGIQTLWHFRRLLSIRAHGGFAVKLWSHKVLRWALPPMILLLGPAIVIGSSLVGPGAALLSGAGLLALILATVVTLSMENPQRLPGVVTAAAFVGMSTVAGTMAWIMAALPPGDGRWSPTPRRTVSPSDS